MATAGPNSPGTLATDNSYGNVAWANTSNAASSNNAYAECNLSTYNDPSEYLKVTNFGFSIPAGSTIDGIVVDIERKSQGSGATHTDNRARIVKSGVVGATDKSSATTWPTTDTVESYGGASDLWGETWSVADINSSTFGFVLAIDNAGGSSRRGYVDHIQITVHYTAGGGGGAAPTRTLLGVGK